MGVESIEDLVQTIKAELFFPSPNLSSLRPSSAAYDTAWVAMVPDPQHPGRPKSPRCLDWVLRNQRDGGFWGVPGSLDCITATLACLVALRTWSVGSPNIEEGLRFLHANVEKMAVNYHAAGLEWFAIVFPGMIELARAKGLEVLPDGYTDAVNDVFLERDRILEMNEKSSGGTNVLVELYFEALPARYRTKHDVMRQLIRGEKGLQRLRSPSATAGAVMATGHEGCIDHLKTVVDRCGDGVPSVYPVDEDLIGLCLVDHLERLGCGEHFAKEIRDLMDHAYSHWAMEEQQCPRKHDAWLQLYKDSLSFRLLRMHGYPVSPRRLCWFVHDEEMLKHMEENYTHYMGAMYSIYRASHFLFPQEDDLEKAKVFSRKMLEKGLACDHLRDDGAATLTDFQAEIEYELRLPWLARMDHLEHRKYIERNAGYVLWLGKASSCRLSFPSNVVQLAKKNFMARQLVYRAELEELKRWSKDTLLSDMGFGREKTTYCYFAIAATTYLPFASNVRKVITKCAVLVTVADDFFDEEGSMDELYSLTKAVKRWEGGDLSGHSKVIFEALDDLVSDITFKSFNQQGYDNKKILQDIWIETFESWLKESEWSRSRQAPSIKEYLKVGMISIGIQAMLLPSFYLMSPQPLEYIIIYPYKPITRLLMVSARLLNDIQSYQKEVKDGKLNMVLLYLKENQKEDIEDSIAHIKNTVDRKEKELLALVLSDGYSEIPKEWKELHLSFLKAFQMFFNSSNAYDSPTAILQDISLAIYDPLVIGCLKSSTKSSTISLCLEGKEVDAVTM